MLKQRKMHQKQEYFVIHCLAENASESLRTDGCVFQIVFLVVCMHCTYWSLIETRGLFKQGVGWQWLG